jgi:hypothetical protein
METTPRLDRLPTPPSPARRGIGLLGLLGLELFALTLRFDTQGLMGAAPWWAVWLGFAPAGLSIGLASVAAFLVLVGPRLPTLWQALHRLAATTAGGAGWLGMAWRVASLPS